MCRFIGMYGGFVSTCLYYSVILNLCTVDSSSETVNELSETNSTPDYIRYDALNHDDRESVQINIEEISYAQTSIHITWALSPSEDGQDINSFTVILCQNNSSPESTIDAPPNVTDMELTSLSPGTAYKIYVNATYATGHTLMSRIYNIRTEGAGPDNPCSCNSIGSNVSVSCDRMTMQCACVDDHTTGIDCGACVEGFYWISDAGCSKCPCDTRHYRTNGHCTIENNVAVCSCFDHYGGHTCSQCADGYYKHAPMRPSSLTDSDMDNDLCVPCICNNNTHGPIPTCHALSGDCNLCRFNTTGSHCDRCMDGYVGDAVSGRNCTKSEGHFGSVSHRSIVGGLCIGVGVVILFILGVIVYKKWWRHRRRPFKFWTIELQNNHEQVNFSTMMDQPDYHRIEGTLAMDDPQYFDPDSRSIVKNPHRSRLTASGYRTLNTGNLTQ